MNKLHLYVLFLFVFHSFFCAGVDRTFAQDNSLTNTKKELVREFLAKHELSKTNDFFGSTDGNEVNFIYFIAERLEESQLATGLQIISQILNHSDHKNNGRTLKKLLNLPFEKWNYYRDLALGNKFSNDLYFYLNSLNDENFNPDFVNAITQKYREASPIDYLYAIRSYALVAKENWEDLESAYAKIKHKEIPRQVKEEYDWNLLYRLAENVPAKKMIPLASLMNDAQSAPNDNLLSRFMNSLWSLTSLTHSNVLTSEIAFSEDFISMMGSVPESFWPQIIHSIKVNGLEATYLWALNHHFWNEDKKSSFHTIEKVHEVISSGNYVERRSLKDYYLYLGYKFKNCLNGLKPGSHVVDMGCGEGIFIKDLAAEKSLKVSGVTYSMHESNKKELSCLPNVKILTGKYFENFTPEELNSLKPIDLIVDVLGILTYSADPAGILDTYFNLLAKEGRIFVAAGCFNKAKNIETGPGQFISFKSWLKKNGVKVQATNFGYELSKLDKKMPLKLPSLKFLRIDTYLPAPHCRYFEQTDDDQSL